MTIYMRIALFSPLHFIYRDDFYFYGMKERKAAAFAG